MCRLSPIQRVTLSPLMSSSNSGSDRKSTRLNSGHRCISYAVFCLKKKKKKKINTQTKKKKTYNHKQIKKTRQIKTSTKKHETTKPNQNTRQKPIIHH